MSPTDVWLLSNGIGGLAFAGLTGLLACTHGGSQTRFLVVACGVNAAWCLLMAAALVLHVSGPWLDLAETVRSGVWLAFLAWLLPGDSLRQNRVIRAMALALPALLIVLLLTQFALQPATEGAAQRSTGFFIGAAAMAFCALVMLEQIYRAANADERWGMKYLVIAVGLLFAYDFVMYSHALLYAGIPLNVWEARGVVNALAVPLIAVSADRHPAWSRNLRLSHQAAFHTGAVVVAGGYLLFTALGGYYIRNFGGSWSDVFGVLFVVVTLLAFAVLLLSGQIRSRAKVYIRKHFFNYKYDYREEWLGLTRRLEQSDDASDPYERSIRAVAHIIDSPAGALWLARDGVYDFVCQWNMAYAEDTTEAPDTPFTAFLAQRHWIIDLDEYRHDPGHYDHLVLPGWLTRIPRVRLVVPLFFEARLLGFMLLAVPRARYALTWEDLDLLRTLGSQVGSFLGQQENHVELAQARQFEAYNRLTAFLMHDLKNIASQQSLILQNVAKHRHNPEFIDDMIMTVESSVMRMQGLLEQLQRTGGQADRSRRVSVGAVAQQMLDTLKVRTPLARLICEQELFVHVDPERFAMILGHVVRNAQDATDADGRVEVRIGRDADAVRIAVVDDGAGMTAAFIRESLFKPFCSTKSARGMGIGAYQARVFAKSAGGRVEVESVPGAGTTFTLVLPSADIAHPEVRPMAVGMK